GTVELLPVVNEPAFRRGERTAEDGLDLARVCPGSADGSTTMQIAHAQQNASAAHALDLCVAYAGRDEMADMTKLTSLFREAIRLPMVIDSTNPAVIEAALQNCPGRPIINSIHLEDGGETLGKITALAKKYGAALIALTIDEDGMAMTAERKLAIAKRIHDLVVNTYGMESCDLIFDPLTFTVGSGDESLRTAGIETLDALRAIHTELPGVLTTLGLSNISFGLKGTCRKVLNSVFLHEAVEAGLSTAIVHAAMILPSSKFTDDERELSLDLIYNRRRDEEHDPLMAIIEAFADHSGDKAEKPVSEFASREDELQKKVFSGDREDLDSLLAVLRKRYRPVEIINRFLIPAMRHVGELFGRGDMLLPFVLASAETMRAAVDLLEPYMTHSDGDSKTKVLLATVAGDVHDIGKNLVDIILSNNGYTVYNIGIKIGVHELIEQAKELNVDLIGLSGLLVKSTIIMRENLAAFEKAGLNQPVLLGGAALTPGYVANDCVPVYPNGQVVYCKDAFEGLRSVADFEAGTLQSTLPPETNPACTSCCIEPGKPVASAELDEFTAPAPAKAERVIETDITLDELFGAVNKAALFRARWGLKKQDRTDDEFAAFLAEEAEPRYAALRTLCEEKNLLEPTILRAFYPCHSDGNTLWVTDTDGDELPLRFPRQSVAPGLSLADYFHPDGDHVAMHLVTIGAKLDAYCHELYEAGEFQDYLFLHALGVELTEAAADLAHERIRRDWGIEATQGCRWSFGYSSCPNLDDQTKLFALLRPEEIGVTLTENMQMVPEFATSAIASAHPQATYFSV
ncbi:MAG: dihydropteroate synthase, partial [Phycisphaerales bacterium]|nr:dihydropteroate synthase [Phycisphaerales bacterium]